MYYIPNFITTQEERHILASLPSHRWIQLSHRRLQAHPSVLSKSNTLLESPLPEWLTEPIIPRLLDLGSFNTSSHKAPNHVLINEYKPGEGIMPHEDGSAYYPIVATVGLGASIVLDIYDKHSEIATARADTDADTGTDPEQIQQRRPKWRVLQEPRSLLITTGGAYTDLLHGITEVEVDRDLRPDTVANWSLLGNAQKVVDGGEEEGSCNVRGTRTSLTYRDVLKISKIGARIFGKPKQ